MPAAVRRERIVARVDRDGSAQLADLSDTFAVSPVTIHRDLELLAAEGRVMRVRGGVASLGGATAGQTSDFARRLAQAVDAKHQIAEHATAIVAGATTIFLDASTTALALAHALAARSPSGLTLVTNSPVIAAELQCLSIHVVVTPGELNQDLRLIAGRWTAEFVRDLNIEIAFVSGVGLTLEHGLMTGQRDVADVLTQVRTVAARTVALVDASKLGVKSLLSIAPMDQFSAVVTDPAITPEWAQRLAATGVRLEIAASA